MVLYRLTALRNKPEYTRAVRIARWWRLQRLRLLRETATATRAGLGFALGAFIGIMPSFGVDAVMAFFLARWLNLGARAAAIGTLVMNPFTAPFFYGSGAHLGAVLFRGDGQWPGWGQLLADPGRFGPALLAGCVVVSLTSASVLGSGVYLWLRAKRTARVQA